LEADIVYTQDIGLAAEGHVTNNEAYNAHYIDHRIFETKQGYVLCSRQNQNQPGGHPFYQQGCMGRAVGFSVDGFPFFGFGYKFDNGIHDLTQPTLNNRVYQYEFAYAALQSEAFRLRDDAHITFYGAFQPDLEKRITSPLPHDEIEAKHKKITFPQMNEKKQFAFAPDIPEGMAGIQSSAPFSPGEINDLYPNRRHEEITDGKLLSFFTPDGAHVVLAEKERVTERPHGHIIANLSDEPHGVLASTSYIYGVFDSQIVAGNTTFNALNTHHRCGLNSVKKSGRRLMIRINGVFKTLAMPAVYEMGMNYARWLYKLDNDVLTVITCVGVNAPLLKLAVVSEQNKAYDFLLCDALMKGIEVRREGQTVLAAYAPGTMTANHYPDLLFELSTDAPFTLTDDRRFYPAYGSQGENLMVMEITRCTGFTLDTRGFIDGKKREDHKGCDFSIADEIESYRRKSTDGMLGFHLSIDNALTDKVDRFNYLTMWYSHNARIHYASPHGLEQSGGAAWGLRDVCQGPFEYFLATQNYGACRHILSEVYARQYLETGDWPQWFMFDAYRKIQHHESHGDIILWPLKALCAYMEATEDYPFLETPLPYTHIEGYEATREAQTILEHVKRQMDAIAKGFIEINGEVKFLSRYGGGDWDDTLQPARRELAQNMVSGWTVALTYQVYKDFSRVMGRYDDTYAKHVDKMAQSIKDDYYAYLIKDGVAAGFMIFGENEGPTYLLHPNDEKTGIKYRLLPMIRGMISEIFTPELAEGHYGLIREHLYHPDGVRLMSATPTYRGGENMYFMRAETSASFAREVSLHYVHAHIRFIEAMAKLGKGGEAWSALCKVNPILLHETVPNAAPRQSNTYFTSSDAAFDNRYDAMEGFRKLRKSEVAVKSGWRLYSSGPGIYLNQLISHVLGLRIKGADIIIDPVLPVELDGLRFQYRILGKAVTFIYRVTGDAGVTKVSIDGRPEEIERLEGVYRPGGALMHAGRIKDGCTIEVYVSGV
jgi:cellobiose phosphorylase